MKTYRLSKSKIISGLQCPKRLYLEVHHAELRHDSEKSEALFASGHRVGEVAQLLVPEGVMVEMENWDIDQALEETRRLLEPSNGPPLFEATFFHNDVLIRADIFFPESCSYRLVEVKASTKVKDYYLNDCAIQAWVIENAGYPIHKVELAHVDNRFIYPGNGNYDGLFYHADITEETRQRQPLVPGWIADFQKMLSEPMPATDVGSHCYDPFECPFIDYCSPKEPDYPVAILPRGCQEAEALLAMGVDDVRDIPSDYLSNPIHERIREATINGEPYINPYLKSYFQCLAYPRYYLDFETIGSAVPLWPGTRPYQTHLPFQWSVHVEKEPGAINHKEFLDLSGKNPIRPLTEALLDALGETGPIFVYSHFEKSVFGQLAAFCPDLVQQLEDTVERFEDLLPLMRRYYYHPNMMGSWSIKAVLPTVAPELNYDDLEEVQDGGGAQAAYFEACFLRKESERYKSLRNNLLAYCKLDTLAMVRLVQHFLNNP
jgi:hypothetical protein